jgi:hypothetical protein
MAGCLPRYDAGSEARAYETAPICCRSPAEFPFEPLWSPLITTGDDIDANSPFFEFAGGKSPFRAYALPDAQGPLHLRIQSAYLPNPWHETRALLPLVTLLDRDKNVIGTTPPAAVAYGRDGPYVDIDVGGPADATRYIVVHTAPSLTDAPFVRPSKPTTRINVSGDPFAGQGSYFGRITILKR